MVSKIPSDWESPFLPPTGSRGLRPVPLSFGGDHVRRTANAQAFLVPDGHGCPYLEYRASRHTNRRKPHSAVHPWRARPKVHHLTPLAHPVQSHCYKASLVPQFPTLPHPSTSPHHPLDTFTVHPLRLLRFHNAVLRKHHHLRLLLLTTRRGHARFPSSQSDWTCKDAAGQSPQPLRDHHARAGSQWIDTEGTAS